jgi:predicted CXXCH cytochrome family protein
MSAISLCTRLIVGLFVTGGQVEDPRAPDPSAPRNAARNPLRALVWSHTKGVVGSVHDFSARGGQAGGACDACHIPHIQAITIAGGPVTQPSIELYRMPGQRRAFRPNEYMPGPTSLVCLGCHDGTVATSTIGSSHALLAAIREGFIVDDGFTWRDHPIGVTYPQNRPDYRPAAFVVKAKKIRLPDGRIECVSCHDPHNDSGVPDLLVMSNRRSSLCLACHIK